MRHFMFGLCLFIIPLFMIGAKQAAEKKDYVSVTFCLLISVAATVVAVLANSLTK